MNTQKQIDKKEEELKVLKEKLKKEQEKNIWLKIPEKNIEITTKQQFNGKTYPEILKEVKKSEIADYELLQELRNTGKYSFLKDFWVFVPNPDKISKKNNYVARFGAGSGGAGLGCDGYPGYSYSSLGVFLIRKIKEKGK